MHTTLIRIFYFVDYNVLVKLQDFFEQIRMYSTELNNLVLLIVNKSNLVLIFDHIKIIFIYAGQNRNKLF